MDDNGCFGAKRGGNSSKQTYKSAAEVPDREKKKEVEEELHCDETDIFRDTELRYLGYANEVGEAFRGLIRPAFVSASYGIASGYVVADSYHKGVAVYKKECPPDNLKKSILATSDALIWQSFASVIIPGFLINRVCAFVRYVQGTNFIQCSSIKFLRNTRIPTVIGLLTIPFIIHPIDRFVDKAMDASFRQWTIEECDDDKDRPRR